MSLLLKPIAISGLPVVMAVVGLLSGCAAPITQQAPSAATNGLTPTVTAPPYNGGGYYKDDGPGANPPANLDAVPDAVPRKESTHRYANDPYRVMGVTYTPDMTGPYKHKGLASWYGRKFHGKPTASGEIYDMYAMTAAHRTLPLPSFVRVTHVESGRSVVVRVNDRGPFHEDRLIDLSYTAAHKLGLLKGVGRVEVELLHPEAEAAPLAEPIRIYKAPETAMVQAQPLVIESVFSGDAIWLQLGVFSKRESADALMQQASQTLASNGAGVQQKEGGGLIRVQAGPFTTQAEADSVSQLLAERLKLKPYKVQDGKPVIAPRPPVAAPTTPPLPAASTTVSVAPTAISGLYLQVAAVSKPEAVEALWLRIKGVKLPGIHKVEAGTMIKVQTGPFATPAEAEAAALALEKILGVKPFRITH